MNRAEFEITDPSLIDLFLSEAQSLTLATLDADGAPYATQVNFVWFQGRVYIHSGPRGRKLENLRRDGRVFLSCAEEFAFIPSYATDAEKACNATHFFRSVHISGPATEVESTPVKAEVLSALMAKMQPEGRHRPLSEPRFEAALRATVLIEVRPAHLSAKFKFGQHLSEAKREGLLKVLAASADQRAASTARWIAALGPA